MKIIFRFFLMTIAIVVVMSVLGCDRQDASQSSSKPEGTKQYTVYLITMDKTDQHWVAVRAGAKIMADQLGIKFKWDAPDTKDVAKQVNILNNAVADQADAILLASLSPTGLGAGIQKALDAGVKVIYVDSPGLVPVSTQLLTNNYNAGVLAGQTMLEELKKAGITSGAVGVVDVDGTTRSTVDRVAGFVSIIKAQNDYTLGTVDSTSSGDAAAAQNIATNMINADDKLVGLFASNEGTTVGTGNAIKNASNRTIISIGFDKSNRIQALLDDGTLKAVMAQNPFTMGYLGVAQAYAALEGLSTGPRVIDTGVSVIRK